jgi:uncharacterized protein (TIGR02996 family)
MHLPVPLLHAVAETPYDDAPRLVCADWLEEHGDPDRAEFIRVQCELEPMRGRYDIARAAELHEMSYFGLKTSGTIPAAPRAAL